MSRSGGVLDGQSGLISAEMSLRSGHDQPTAQISAPHGRRLDEPEAAGCHRLRRQCETRTWSSSRDVDHTIRRILKKHGIEPAPERPTTWRAFLSAHWGAICASDFFTVEVLTLTGLVRYSLAASSVAASHDARNAQLQELP